MGGGGRLAGGTRLTRAFRNLVLGILLAAFAATGCGSSDLVSPQAETGVPQDDAVAAEVDDAVAFAEAGTLEPVADLTRFVTSEVVP